MIFKEFYNFKTNGMNLALCLSQRPWLANAAIERRITFNVTGKDYAGHDHGDQCPYGKWHKQHPTHPFNSRAGAHHTYSARTSTANEFGTERDFEFVL